nr:reverse transcriptase domain-containing protein [Tanacetum cinerariifolium]
MPPKRNSASAASTSNAPAMNHAAIRQLVVDSVPAALEAKAANMTNADNTNRNPEPREAPVARKCSYKEFMRCQPFNFKGSEGAVGLIRWFKRTESVFSHSNCTENCKELATLRPTMVSDFDKNMEAFIGGLPRSIKGNVTASKPQTLEEAINIAQRLIDQCHMTRNYSNKGPATGSNLLPMIVTCHVCGEKGHYANQFRMTTNNNAQGRAYMLRDRNAHRDPNVVTVRQVEFQIDLIPRAAPVTHAPYRLALLEMQELSDQLQELADRGLASYYRRFIKDFSNIAKYLTELTQKNKKYIWGEDQETTFQLLKQKLGESSILALPEGNDDFVVYCDASHQGLGAVLMQREKKELNKRQRRWLELLIEYDCEIRYHLGKANVVADALSQKEQIKPLRVRSLVMTIHPKLPSQIFEAQNNAIKKKTSKPITYEEWTKHLKYVLMELVILRIEVGYHSLVI